MIHAIRIAVAGLMLGSLLVTSGCVIAPQHEGYYDRAHHRYYHDHHWHRCTRNDAHCR
ncbi:MAG: hypothetical protein ACRET2_17225 [Steroidobacteraceae bacterium]